MLSAPPMDPARHNHNHRYRFVIDRAKKLLENSDLASLRRAVDADVNLSTTNESNTTLAIHEGADSDRRRCPTPKNSLQEGADAAAGDSWDRFVLPLPAQRGMVAHAGEGSSLGAPLTSGGGMMSPWRSDVSGSRGRGELAGNVTAKQADQAEQADHSSKAKGVGRGGRGSWHDPARSIGGGGERQALSLAQLSISSKTVAFPPGHVPSVLGARGHGRKRGRINHFAVRTPPSTADRGNGNSNGNDSGGSGISGEGKSAGDPNDDSDTGPSETSALQVCATSAWILPHQLDPTSAITDLGVPPCGENASATNRSGKKGGGGTAASRSSFEPPADSPSNPMLSRASSCATINSPSRVSAIMLGMATGISKDHTLHPPPPAAAPYANRCSLRKGKRVPVALAHRHNGGADFSFGGSSICTSVFSCSDTSDEHSPIRIGFQPYLQEQPSTSVTSGYYPSSGQLMRVSPRPPARSGEETAITAGYGGTRAGGLLRDGDLLESCSLHALPPGRCDGAGGGTGDGPGGTDDNNSNHLGLSLPLLRQTPGTGVRDEPYQIAGGVATEAMLGSSASVGGWKNDDDRSISTTNDDDPSISTTTGGGESLDEPSHHGRTPGGGEKALAGEDIGRQRQCDPPAWSLGDASTTIGRTAAASGFSDVTISRGESGLRGWTVGQAVPASHRT